MKENEEVLNMKEICYDYSTSDKVFYSICMPTIHQKSFILENIRL